MFLARRAEYRAGRTPYDEAPECLSEYRMFGSMKTIIFQHLAIVNR
jgi:hypothetical protein